MGCEVVHRMYLAHKSTQWHVLVDKECNHKFPQKVQNFFSCWVTISFSGLNLSHGVSYMWTYCFRWASFASDMEEDEVLSGNYVWHPIPIICNRTKTSSCWDASRVLLQIQFWCLSMRCLGCGQSPGLTQHFFEKWRIYLQVLGYHIKAEEVTVNALTTHGILVCHLMYSACDLQ